MWLIGRLYLAIEMVTFGLQNNRYPTLDRLANYPRRLVALSCGIYALTYNSNKKCVTHNVLTYATLCDTI